MDVLGGFLALGLTLALFTYLAGDNPVYRIAAHLFIGLTSGYVVVLAWYSVIWPNLAGLARVGSSGDAVAIIVTALAALIGGVGGVLLLLKTVHVAPRLGGLVVAFMLGVGAAVAVGGAITGTLLPQISAAMVSLLPRSAGQSLGEVLVEGLFTLVGTLATLGFFWYGGKAEPGNPVERPALLRPIAAVGQVFIAVTFGVMYAGALAASVALFAERLSALTRYLGL
ncbi:MAG: hypothetical protein IT317_04040 [Anaerolineales bacterium]|nr:hypothetical protein [Anaerolineales bacterium]